MDNATPLLSMSRASTTNSTFVSAIGAPVLTPGPAMCAVGRCPFWCPLKDLRNAVTSHWCSSALHRPFAIAFGRYLAAMPDKRAMEDDRHDPELDALYRRSTCHLVTAVD